MTDTQQIQHNLEYHGETRWIILSFCQGNLKRTSARLVSVKNGKTPSSSNRAKGFVDIMKKFVKPSNFEHCPFIGFKPSSPKIDLNKPKNLILNPYNKPIKDYIKI
ncbi:hypothetical protein CEXT_493051 [Caerostris extrusa]|uniref:LAGLIDADG homing endonuclease n=1 Tax=Caerostris extrusa TaxID=172846 RepID=A0AAV4RAV4_CAEEX|nr:hypothetical protein CEXT_493051 [Caerostris extrusa]